MGVVAWWVVGGGRVHVVNGQDKNCVCKLGVKGVNLRTRKEDLDT